MPLAGKSRFPSALTRSSGDSGPLLRRRREPTAAQLAMMNSDQIRAYYQSRGEWTGADRELLSTMRNPEEMSSTWRK
jgi:hypothetical protein